MNLENLGVYMQRTPVPRRAVLGAAGVGMLALSGLALPAIAQEREDPIAQKKESIYQAFRIKVLTLREVYSLKGDVYPETPDFQSAPEWTMEQLNLLGSILSHLPSELYSADANGEYYIALGKEQNNDQDTPPVLSFCDCIEGSARPPGVVLSTKHHMSPDFPFDAWTFTTHELTHLLNLAKQVKGENNPAQNYPHHRLEDLDVQLFSRLTTAKSLRDMHEQVEPVLQRKYIELANLHTKWENTKNDIERKQLLKQYDEENVFYQSMIYMVTGREDTIELYPTLAQNYVQGSNFFMKHYTEYFGILDTQTLYSIIRENIFFGEEYEAPFMEKGP